MTRAEVIQIRTLFIVKVEWGRMWGQPDRLAEAAVALADELLRYKVDGE